MGEERTAGPVDKTWTKEYLKRKRQAEDLVSSGAVPSLLNLESPASKSHYKSVNFRTPEEIL